MGALGSAISGLQASQQWLDVISNNVANSQTVAYKSGRVSFADLVNEGLRSASGPSSTSNLGGIDPEQLGLGVGVSTIQTLMTQGAVQVTGQATDVAIQGSGFLTVKSGDQTLYTRAGNLTFDSAGNLGDGGRQLGPGLAGPVQNHQRPQSLDACTTVLGSRLEHPGYHPDRFHPDPPRHDRCPQGHERGATATSIKDQGVDHFRKLG